MTTGDTLQSTAPPAEDAPGGNRRDAAASAERWGAHGARVIFDEIEKHFDAVAAVDGVSLDIAPGEFVTLLGPSGSGKTTSLMMLAGFEIPTAGEIYIEDQPISAVPPFQRNIGMVFQNYALFPHMTVGENIAFPLKLRKQKRGRGRATNPRCAGAGRIARLRGTLPAPTLRRAAATDSARPGTCFSPPGVADGRAVGRTR